VEVAVGVRVAASRGVHVTLGAEVNVSVGRRV
jgi:hypothetical protein